MEERENKEHEFEKPVSTTNDNEDEIMFLSNFEPDPEEYMNLEPINNYRLNFFELPILIDEPIISLTQIDKKLLNILLMLDDCKYENLDKIGIQYGRVKLIEYVLFDFSNIELECLDAKYALLLEDEFEDRKYYTLEIDKSLCFCKLEEGFHSLINFYDELTAEEFVNLCIKDGRIYR